MDDFLGDKRKPGNAERVAGIASVVWESDVAATQICGRQSGAHDVSIACHECEESIIELANPNERSARTAEGR